MARAFSIVMLLGLALSPVAFADEPSPVRSAAPRQVQQTVDRAIGYLQTESAAWLKTRGCAACHHVPMALWALSEAEQQGYAIDKSFLTGTTESLLGSKDKLLSSRIFPNPADPPDPRPQGGGLNMGLPFLAVAARALPSLAEGQKQSLKLIAEEIVKKQQPDGSWEFFATLRRPPINESQTTDAAWIIMALQGETAPDAPESQRAALSKAIAWLDSVKPSDNHQDKVLRVLMGTRAGKPRETIQATIDDLLALQRADGGWSQTVPEWQSDAFATGQTLYALSLAGYTADRPEIQRAIDFLVATQKPDGSWPMRSRSTPNGQPGSAKLLTPITCAASSWATLGLARLAPKRLSDLKRLESLRERVRQGLVPVNRLGGAVDPSSRVVGDSDLSARTWMAADPNATGEVQKLQAGFADTFRRLDPEPASRTRHFAWLSKRDDVRQVGWAGMVLAMQPQADGSSLVKVRMRPRFNAGGYKVMLYDFVDEIYAYANRKIVLIASDAAVTRPDLQRLTLFH